FDSLSTEKFEDFPLSEKTKKGLRESNFVTPTEIQKESVGLALKGHDILGAAKTGSGKTLAFLLPVAGIQIAKFNEIVKLKEQVLSLNCQGLDKELYFPFCGHLAPYGGY
ncbi:ATP-dependent RNA helicase DBP4, partial [Araneus ventricosus]